ncbi:MAG: SAM-dependent methyltransferase [Thermoprotei archaeon]|nr:MAG: SAM-dependent methyltransferase [Thermoprotei archaeon]
MEYFELSETPFFRKLSVLQVPYLATPIEIARRMLALAEAKPGELVVDLGCGDGRILIIAAEEYGCRCIGVEIDRKLADLARKNVKKRKLNHLVKILTRNLMNFDISQADIITLYLTPIILEKISRKLERELKKGARVVSHDYQIPGWTYLIKEEIPTHGYHVHKIYLYRK